MLGHTDTTYVIFDGDEDMWAYGYMKGWNAKSHLAFNFKDAHDAYPLRADAFVERTVKAKMRLRFETAAQVIVLVGEKTKNLYRYVRWEIEVAQELDLPIIVVNLSNLRHIDRDRCPPILRDTCAVHVNFRMRIIQHALNHFPSWHQARNLADDKAGPRHYYDSVYLQTVGALD